MRQINNGDVKKNFSHLIKEAVRGETFVISKAGKPKVKVIPIDATESEVSPTTPPRDSTKSVRKG
ncbi:hypothetical protein BH10PSE9_BH10PSE9_03240 [soil metagenome]